MSRLERWIPGITRRERLVDDGFGASAGLLPARIGRHRGGRQAQFSMAIGTERRGRR